MRIDLTETLDLETALATIEHPGVETLWDGEDLRRGSASPRAASISRSRPLSSRSSSGGRFRTESRAPTSHA